MTLQDVGQFAAALGGLAGVGAVIDGIRRRRKLSIDQGQAVANSAVALVERLELRIASLERQLTDATERAESLSNALREAKIHAEDLQESHDQVAAKLADAQLEIRHLRLQIKSLSDELDRLINNPGEGR